MYGTPTNAARGRFILRMLAAQFYAPQIQQRLGAYQCHVKWRQFVGKRVKGARGCFSHNDPRLFERARELVG